MNWVHLENISLNLGLVTEICWNSKNTFSGKTVTRVFFIQTSTPYSESSECFADNLPYTDIEKIESRQKVAVAVGYPVELLKYEEDDDNDEELPTKL